MSDHRRRTAAVPVHDGANALELHIRRPPTLGVRTIERCCW